MIVKKYWIFKNNWAFVYLKKGKWKFEYKNMSGYWIIFIGRFILSNDIMKLNKDWSAL